MSQENGFLNQTMKSALREMKDLARSGDDDAIDELGRNINKMIYALRGVATAGALFDNSKVTPEQAGRATEWLKDNAELLTQAIESSERRLA